MTLEYKLTFGKFKGHSLKDIADNNPWYLNWIASKTIWLKDKLKTELSKEDFLYLAKAQNKYNSELDNQRMINSYFPRGGSNDNDDDYSNFCGVHGFF